MAKIASFSPLFHLQSKSINFNSGHFSSKTKGYSLTFWPKLPHFHHFFISNQNQSISILVNFSSKTKGYSLTFWPKLPHFHHFFISNQNQSISILVIFHQKPKVIALLFGQNCLIFTTFSSPIKINQFQFWSFSSKTKVIALLFGQNCLIFTTFSSPIKNQSISILVIFHQKPKVIALLFGQNCLIFTTFSSPIKINQFQFWSFCIKTKGYSLTFWPKLPHFHHFFISNQNQSISILVIFHQKPKVIALLFGQNCLIFTTFSSPIKINQFQFWSFFIKNQRL